MKKASRVPVPCTGIKDLNVCDGIQYHKSINTVLVHWYLDWLLAYTITVIKSCCVIKNRPLYRDNNIM